MHLCVASNFNFQLQIFYAQSEIVRFMAKADFLAEFREKQKNIGSMLTRKMDRANMITDTSERQLKYDHDRYDSFSGE